MLEHVKLEYGFEVFDPDAEVGFIINRDEIPDLLRYIFENFPEEWEWGHKI